MTFWTDLRKRYGRAYNDGEARFPDGGFQARGHYDLTDRWTEAARTIRDLLEEHGVKGRVLDLGGGRGGLVGRLPRCITLDLGDDAMRPPGVQGNAVAMPFLAGSFGAVVALDLIEHVPWDWQSRLARQEIQRVLVPGGLVVATVPVTEEQATFTSFSEFRHHYLSGPATFWGALFFGFDFEILEAGEPLARRGAPFNFGDCNYPFLLRYTHGGRMSTW